MEPERRIEKLLRAFAKKRREQAGDPVELHPVARQQLQKEIARRAAGTSSSGWFSSFFMGFRPRLAFALCFVALAITALVLLPNLTERKPQTLASSTLERREMAPTEKTPPALSPPPVITVAPPAAGEGARAFQDKQPAVSGSLALKSVKPEPAGANRKPIVPPIETPKQAEVFGNNIAQTEASTGVAVASTAPSSKETLAYKSDNAAFDDSLGGASVAGSGALSKDVTRQALPSVPRPTGIISVTTNETIFAANEDVRKKMNLQKQSVAPATVSGAFFDSGKSEVAATTPPVSQIFNRSDILTPRLRATNPLSGSSPVLVSFRMEQTGNAMRVVDADGSVYTGAVQVAQQAGVTRAVPPKNAPSAAQMTKTAAPSQAAQNYFFRVAGTNRNLKQNVVFSGNLIPLTNTMGPFGGGGGGGIGGAVSARPALDLPVELLLSNSRISGKAVIGDQKEIEVNATPAP